MIRKALAISLGLLLVALCPLVAAPPASNPPIPVEISKPLPKAKNLGTMGYMPLDNEKPFLQKVNEPDIDLWGTGNVIPPPPPKTAKPATQPTAEKPKPYTLEDQDGKYVGWYAIVRENTWDEKTGQTTLLLEHKYSDGLTDLHIQVVSIYGAGDFHAVLKQKLAQIPKLSLVRVYGKAALQKDGTITVTPEYMRVWDWGLFTFMDYGPDKSNQKWIQLRKITGPDVYSPHPDKTFYEDRLGKR